MLRIIINADDLGANETVNAEIERFIQLGVISSTTIIANGKAFEDVKRIVDNNPDISFGIHLCIDEFESLTNSQCLKDVGIIDKDGFFVKGKIFEITHFKKELLKDIYQELYCQIKKLRNTGIEITHIDSHHHFHVKKELCNILIQLANEFNIKKIRRPFSYTPYQLWKMKKPVNKVNSVKVKGVNSKRHSNFMTKLMTMLNLYYQEFRWRKCMNNKLITTDKFYSYSSFYLNYQLLLKRKQHAIIELMCHPGHPLYRDESVLVENKKIKTICNYKLITYKDL